MSTLTYIFIALCLPAVFCEGEVIQQNGTNDRIIGGSSTNIEYYKWQVSLLSRGSHTCGGAIISSSWVITAAHCFGAKSSQEILSYYTVRAGSSYQNVVNQARTIYYYVKHQNYISSGFDWDIALIYVNAPFVYSSTVYPIPLTNYEPTAGTVVYVSGWGITKNTDTTTPNQLKSTYVYVQNRQYCAQTNPIFTARVICVKGSGTATCPGDSGGPGIIWDASRKSYALAGVVGFGTGSAEKCTINGGPSGFTNVYYMRSWIKYYTGF